MMTSSFLRTRFVTLAIVAALVPITTVAQGAPEAGKWQFAATLNGWLPAIDGTVNFPGDGGGPTGIHVSMGDVLVNLKMTFQGTLDAHYGRWGMFTDVVYVDLGGSTSRERDFSIGNVGIPAGAIADLSLDLKAMVWTVAGQYRVVSDPAWTVDLLGGARMIRMKPTLDYSVTGNLGSVVLPGGRIGSKQVDGRTWDGIVGVKGRYAFGDDRRWYAPFYVDVGTGQARLTSQITGGIGHTFNWGSVFTVWRYLDYQFKSGQALESTSMSGPMLGVAFQW